MGKNTPRPHTAEWFALMRERHPKQAESTRNLIARVGTDQCCSVCGDTKNAHDYKSIDDEITARLCDECKGLQERMYGARFVPLV